MKIKLISFALVICIIIGFYYLSDDLDGSVPSPTDSVDHDPHVQFVLPADTAKRSQLQSNQVNASLFVNPIEDSEEIEMEVINLNHISNIIKPSEQAQQFLEQAGVIPSDLNGEHYVEFNLDALRALELGDSFDMVIPQTAEEFSAEVTHVTKFPNGDKSVHAMVIGGDGRFHNTVLTVGSDALYGQFTVPSGNYAFESKNQYGWIAAKRDLYRNHIEQLPDQSDSSDNPSHHNHDPISVVTNSN